MRASAELGLTPFAPYHWLMYSQSMWFDIDHVRQQLGWSPRWSNDEMFVESYEWFLAHRREAAEGVSHHRRTARFRSALGVEAGHRPAPRMTERAGRQVGRRAARRACVPPGAVVVARRDAGRHQAVLVSRPGSPDHRRALQLRRSPVRRVGPPPGHRLPVAAGPVVLARRPAGAPGLDRPPVVARHAPRSSGGWGVMWCARRLGLGLVAALTAGLVYQLTPYVLPYVSRTSAMLLPWAGLGWIIGLTVLAGRRGGWRYPATLALVVASVGAVNATALLMVAPAPVVVAGPRHRHRRAALASSVGDGRQGGRAVSRRVGVVDRCGHRAGPPRRRRAELLRDAAGGVAHRHRPRGVAGDGLLARVTSPITSRPPPRPRWPTSTDRPVMVLSFAVPILGVAALTFTRFAARRYAIVLVVTGLCSVSACIPSTTRPR